MEFTDFESGTDDLSLDALQQIFQRSSHPRNRQAIIEKGPDGTTLYCCVECPIKYPDKESLEFHLCMHNSEYRFLCGICGTGLKRREHLERHTLEHKEHRPHICGDCGKAFKRKEHLNIHRHIHTNEKNEVCPICHRSFHRRDHLQKHLLTHNKCVIKSDSLLTKDMNKYTSPAPNRKIEITDLDEKTLLQLQENPVVQTLMLTTRYKNPDRPHVCCICLKTYKRKDHLKLHWMTHLKKECSCSICGKGFHKHQQLQIHIDLHHNGGKSEDGQKPYNISESSNAPQRTQQVEEYQNHQQQKQTHTEQHTKEYKDDLEPIVILDEEPDVNLCKFRTYTCNVCSKTFLKKGLLRAHMFTHVDMKQNDLICGMCGSEFKHTDEFEIHACSGLNTENIPEGQDNQDDRSYYEYDDTSSDNISENSLLRPIGFENVETASVSGPSDSFPVPQKVFVCKVCNKPFRRKDHYKIHLNVHTGIKSFFCPHCEKGFYRKDHLQKHLQVHDKVKKVKTLKPLPDLKPIHNKPMRAVKPEITIHAPTNSKLRIPLQMKVPYQVVTSNEYGEREAVTINPQNYSSSNNP